MITTPIQAEKLKREGAEIEGNNHTNSNRNSFSLIVTDRPLESGEIKENEKRSEVRRFEGSTIRISAR